MSSLLKFHRFNIKKNQSSSFYHFFFKTIDFLQLMQYCDNRWNISSVVSFYHSLWRISILSLGYACVLVKLILLSEKAAHSFVRNAILKEKSEERTLFSMRWPPPTATSSARRPSRTRWRRQRNVQTGVVIAPVLRSVYVTDQILPSTRPAVPPWPPP